MAPSHKKPYSNVSPFPLLPACDYFRAHRSQLERLRFVFVLSAVAVGGGEMKNTLLSSFFIRERRPNHFFCLEKKRWQLHEALLLIPCLQFSSQGDIYKRIFNHSEIIREICGTTSRFASALCAKVLKGQPGLCSLAAVLRDRKMKSVENGAWPRWPPANLRGLFCLSSLTICAIFPHPLV